MANRGKVKWFNKEKGYGFIVPDAGGRDVFVHATALEKAGIGTLKDGAPISYEIENGKNGKESAVDLALIEVA